MVTKDLGRKNFEKFFMGHVKKFLQTPDLERLVEVPSAGCIFILC